MSTDTGSAGVKRRDFLKVLGAAGATGATIGCGTEKVEKLIPYLVQPDNTVPGVSNYYATVVRDCTAGCGVIAEVRDGRAIKLEGNLSLILFYVRDFETRVLVKVDPLLYV